MATATPEYLVNAGGDPIESRAVGWAIIGSEMAKTVAVVGASSDRSKFGNKALRAFQAEGYRVIPINPNESAVEGMRTYPSVLDVPDTIDMATVYVQPDVTLRLLDEFDRKKIPEVWVNPGAESDAVIAEARQRRMNVIFACSIVGIGRNPYQF
jgi:predicted CoA-binding protein